MARAVTNDGDGGPWWTKNGIIKRIFKHPETFVSQLFGGTDSIKNKTNKFDVTLTNIRKNG